MERKSPIDSMICIRCMWKLAFAYSHKKVWIFRCTNPRCWKLYHCDTGTKNIDSWYQKNL